MSSMMSSMTSSTPSISGSPAARVGKPNKKILLQGGVGSLDLGKPLRMSHELKAVQSPNAPIEADSAPIAPGPAAAPIPSPTSRSLVVDESGSTHDTVTPRHSHGVPLSEQSDTPTTPKEQGHLVTQSSHEPDTGTSGDSVTTRQSPTVTESPDDRVTARQSHRMPLSPQSGITPAQTETPDLANRRASTILRQGTLKPKDHYCAIPTALLARNGLFENPYDFMVYLYYFSKSYGFGRNTCDLGISELVEFTGLAKNSVRKSIDRLIAGKWIRMIQNFEYGHVTRKWRVYSPYETGKTEHPTYVEASTARATAAGVPAASASANSTTGSSGDSVVARLSHDQHQTGSSGEPVTGSPRDTYKSNQKDNFIDNSLSTNSAPIREYFAELKPARKRESELQAYREIQKDFSDEDITDCLEHLQHSGLPGGEICHSPMAYLAVAIPEILAIVETERRALQLKAEIQKQRETEDRAKTETAERDRREWEAKDHAFNKTFPGDDRQEEVVRNFCLNHGFPISTGGAARAFAVEAWWKDLNEYERTEVTQ